MYRGLNRNDAFTPKTLMSRVEQQLDLADALHARSDLLIRNGPPRVIRSEFPMIAPMGRATIGDGREFKAQEVRDWITAVGAMTAEIMPGSPRETV